MIVSELYDDTSPEIWKRVIGDDLHYHVGWGDGDILFNAIQYLYQFVDRESSVLDCGCGWGGTGKVLKRDLDCDVTGVTISKVQSDYIEQNKLFDVVHADLHNFIPQKKYDVILFVESFCHLKNPDMVLKNLRNTSDKIVLREYHMKNYIRPERYIDKWLMNLYNKDMIVSMFDGYNLTYEKEHYVDALEPTLDLWYNNIKKLSKEDKTKHIKTLEVSTRFLKRNKDEVLRTVGLSTFVFEKC